jgi:tol-pal system protein YbgF
MQKLTVKALKARIFAFFMFLLVIIPLTGIVRAADDEEISILRNRIIELEKRDIENRVLLADIKELLALLNQEIAALKDKVAKQDELLSAIPRRVPRPTEALEVEDTTAAEVKIENKPLSSADQGKTTLTETKRDMENRQNPLKSENKPPQSGSSAETGDRSPALQPSPDEVEQEPANDKKKLYNVATKFFGTGAYDKALIKFKEYIDKYPDDDLTDNAQYWIGECDLKKGEYLKAVEEFQKVIEYYPLGNKVPDAYLKIGYSYLYLKDSVSALQYFNLVRDMFPHTDASIEAEKKIKEMPKR